MSNNSPSAIRKRQHKTIVTAFAELSDQILRDGTADNGHTDPVTLQIVGRYRDLIYRQYDLADLNFTQSTEAD